MTEELIQVNGELHIERFNAAGELVEERHVENLITTVGKNSITDQLLASPTVTKPTHMAVGTGTTAATLGDTTLQTESGSSRVALTSKLRSTNVLTMVGDWAAGIATGAITEAGVFNASSAGDLYSRAVFSAINKGALDTLKITWTYTLG